MRIMDREGYGKVVIFENDLDEVSTEEFHNASIIAISAKMVGNLSYKNIEK